MTGRVVLAGLLASFALAKQAGAQATYTLNPTPKTWGYYCAKRPLVLCLSYQ